MPPIPIDLLQIQSWFLAVDSCLLLMVLQRDELSLLLSEDLIKTPVGFGSEPCDLMRRVGALLVDYAGHSLQKCLIFTFYLYFPIFLDLMLFVSIDEDLRGVLVMFVRNGFDVLHIELMISVGDL